jgi:hypothetical protein
MVELVKYWHEIMGYPTASTFLRFIKLGRLVLPELPFTTLLK